jgi:hypothetical protein
MADFIKIPFLNPIQVLRTTSDYFAYDLIPQHEKKLNYCQKFQNDDYFTFQFRAITGAGYTATATLKNIYGNVAKTFTITTKLNQIITNYTYFEIRSILTGIADGIYYFSLSITKTGLGTYEFLSEPLHIATIQENTILLTYSNSVNAFDVCFDGYYTRSIEFQFRIEGGFTSEGFTPASKDTVYQNQIYDNYLIDSVPFFTKKLTIGGSIGIPNWTIEKVNRILSCNIIKINNISYCKNDGAKLEKLGADKFYPFMAWSIEMIESKNNYENTYIYKPTRVIGFEKIGIGVISENNYIIGQTNK